MSLINGIGGLGSGLAAFAGQAAEDAATPPSRAQSPIRTPLLNATPGAAVASGESAPLAPADAAQAALAATNAKALNVPADLLPIYQQAAKRTGIPVDVLIAQGKQESGFDPSVVSSTGGIGLHQIQAATARDPGYGVAPVDPATLKDPQVSINFAADYMRARAGSGADFSDPRTVDAALAAYNGGGDKAYVANVRRYMGAPA